MIYCTILRWFEEIKSLNLKFENCLMNLPKHYILMTGAVLSLCTAHAFAAPQAKDEASETVRLPVLTVMADRELRNETVVEPAQEEPAKRKALQQQVMKLERNAQNYAADPTVIQNLDVKAPEPAPNFSGVSLVMQQHILNIAEGLQSSDPRNGLYIMLQPFGIDRNATNVQMGREQLNLGILERTLP